MCRLYFGWVYNNLCSSVIVLRSAITFAIFLSKQETLPDANYILFIIIKFSPELSALLTCVSFGFDIIFRTIARLFVNVSYVLCSTSCTLF